ncbi:protein phosphatase 2C domain-containing protein [Chitinophaga arvensicola]|uniref:Protein phosphatase 2C n=1 Tax=Chitinophaga arvensicola TaxID=29529 RepID=A0A1I0QIV8_9BACT|nr:protein phosphatase 2C domain-containing protein [Chitinophaga arvensicola]SEW26900.1 Protein phosphatase 2C [Chitinophaga arvensicola]
MNIYTTLGIGAYHLNYCEDYLFFDHIDNNRIICAVMDGCTMGKDSYFIATLVGKLLRKICKAFSYKAFYSKELLSISLDEYLKLILKELFSELKMLKNQLQLEKEELLTTLTILLADISADKGLLLVIGDGVVSINGAIVSFDQDNKPDYLGYHLSADFDAWYEDQGQKIFISHLEDISIATDGIETFTRVAAPENSDAVDPISFLLNDMTGAGNEEMLNMKLKLLEHKYGLNHTDDLAIVRIMK